MVGIEQGRVFGLLAASANMLWVFLGERVAHRKPTLVEEFPGLKPTESERVFRDPRRNRGQAAPLLRTTTHVREI